MSGRFAFLVGFVAWWSAVWACMLVPDEVARSYATVWTGAVAVIAALFVVGYVTLSRPTRGEGGQRHWVAEWFWLPTFTGLILLVYTNSLIFRLILPPSASPTLEYLLAQRVTAGIAATVFFLLLWLTVMWVRRQIETRRVKTNPEPDPDEDDYRNGWPPKA